MSALRTPLFFLACLAILIAASSRPSDAAPITGSLDVSGVNVGSDGVDFDLAASTLITGDDMVVTSSAGDLGGIGVGTSFGPLVLDTTDLLASFSFGNATYGSFAGSSALILIQNADLLTLYFLGTFTPGAGLPGLDPTLVRLDVKVERFFGEAGYFLDTTLVLSPQEPAVPEPATLGLLAIGGLALAGRRRLARR
jgi:hypothetical protein